MGNLAKVDTISLVWILPWNIYLLEFGSVPAVQRRGSSLVYILLLME
jgi:hypothetical protein